MVPESRTERKEEQCTQYDFLILTHCVSPLCFIMFTFVYVWTSMCSELQTGKMAVWMVRAVWMEMKGVVCPIEVSPLENDPFSSILYPGSMANTTLPTHRPTHFPQTQLNRQKLQINFKSLDLNNKIKSITHCLIMWLAGPSRAKKIWSASIKTDQTPWKCLQT